MLNPRYKIYGGKKNNYFTLLLILKIANMDTTKRRGYNNSTKTVSKIVSNTFGKKTSAFKSNLTRLLRQQGT